MRLNLGVLVVIIGSVFLNLGCQATSAVISKKKPEKYVEVIQADSAIDVESSLKKSGQKYICKEFYFGEGNHKNRRACFVKAPDEIRYKEFGIKLSKAVVEDTTYNICIIGAVYLDAISSGFISP